MSPCQAFGPNGERPRLSPEAYTWALERHHRRVEALLEQLLARGYRRDQAARETLDALKGLWAFEQVQGVENVEGEYRRATADPKK